MSEINIIYIPNLSRNILLYSKQTYHKIDKLLKTNKNKL